MVVYSSLEKALARLDESLGYERSDASRADPRLRAQFRAAAIQAFEFTYEVGTKLVLRQLEEIVPSPPRLREMGFMDLMRTAADAGLVRDARPFHAYREMRNITSHAYDEKKAEAVFLVLEAFVQDMRFLLAELRRRNDDSP